MDDLAELCVFLMNHYDGNEPVNAGTGKDFTIRELAGTVAKVIGYEGEIRWDASKPNGMPQKLLDVSKALRAVINGAGRRYPADLRGLFERFCPDREVMFF